MLPGRLFWNKRSAESFLHMPSKMHRAGTIKDLLSGRVKRRDECKEAAQARKRKPAKSVLVNSMDLPSRAIDARSYTGLIETLVGMTIKLEVIRETLDPIDDATSTELLSQIRNDAFKAAAFAQLDPGEWERVSDWMVSVLTVKPS